MTPLSDKSDSERPARLAVTLIDRRWDGFSPIMASTDVPREWAEKALAGDGWLIIAFGDHSDKSGRYEVTIAMPGVQIPGVYTSEPE